ncbi:VanW family protein [Schinkia azotoformans]|uniref:VanW family protein n=1 Tax=Schinkia azotoformans TaxID=1454 RepID=UPI002DB71A6B|nr:VanW family protein [Schinkia azotoformans]MEC1742090.1 VanW family protein [Schinkia azotoformans]MEC1765022.1 VanW family protein [Schinkia azotoformans]MEC1785948.1 VanW family protein [Schinkia azotoformans]MED4419723.1 VanW family protein [Schinkia azotoformans]
MSKNLNVKLFGLLITCAGLIFILSYLSTKTYEAVFHDQNPVFASGTMISSISLDGMSKEQAESELTNKIQEWSRASSFSLQYQNKTTELPDNIISIDGNASIQKVKDGQQVELAVVIDKSLLDEAINKTIENKAILKDLDVDKLEEALIHSVQELQDEPKQFQLLAYLKTTGENAKKEITVSNIKGIASQYKNLETILTNQKEFEIGPNETFSFQNAFDSNQSNNEALGMIASGIYDAILPTNFMIVERNISKQLPSYSELGLEAKVSDKMDLVFTNPNPYSYKITFSLLKDTLQVKLIGPPFPYKYSIKKETESYSPKTVLQFSAKLSPIQSKIIDNGKNGLLAKVYREAKDDQNLIVETTFVSEDFYPPVYRVVQSGLLPSEKSATENNSGNGGNDSKQDLEHLSNGSGDLNSTNMLPAETDIENPS